MTYGVKNLCFEVHLNNLKYLLGDLENLFASSIKVKNTHNSLSLTRFCVFYSNEE